MRIQYKKKIFLGIVLIVLSYSSYLLPLHSANIYNLSALLFLFIAGIIFLCEGITLSLANTSLLGEIRRSKGNTWAFISIAVFGAIILDGLAKWFGKLWLYPY